MSKQENQRWHIFDEYVQGIRKAWAQGLELVEFL